MKKKQHANQSKVAERKIDRSESNSSRIHDFAVEILSVFLGALLAIGLTACHESYVEKTNAMALLKIAYQDTKSQANLLSQAINQYERGAITIETLRLNAPLELSIVDEVYLSKYMVELNNIDDGKDVRAAYAVILNSCREINSINNYLSSDHNATDTYIVSLCYNIADNANLLSDMMQYARQYIKKEINHDEFQAWYREYMTDFVSSHPEYIWALEN